MKVPLCMHTVHARKYSLEKKFILVKNHNILLILLVRTLNSMIIMHTQMSCYRINHMLQMSRYRVHHMLQMSCYRVHHMLQMSCYRLHHMLQMSCIPHAIEQHPEGTQTWRSSFEIGEVYMKGFVAIKCNNVH